MKVKILLSFVPVLNIFVVPLYLMPEPESIRSLLLTTMAANGVLLGRIFLKQDLSLAGASDLTEDSPAANTRRLQEVARGETFLTQLTSLSNMAINSFCLNIFLLAAVTLSRGARGRRRAQTVWNLVRFGVLVLLGLMEGQFITIFMLIETWGELVYDTKRLQVLAGAGVVAYIILVVCLVIATFAIPGEVIWDSAIKRRLRVRKKGENCCPFISTLHNMPGTQTTMAMQGMTWQRLKPYKGDRHMLLLIFEECGLPMSDCLDMIEVVQSYTPP